jgi:hypothetical protein
MYNARGLDEAPIYSRLRDNIYYYEHHNMLMRGPFSKSSTPFLPIDDQNCGEAATPIAATLSIHG